MKLVANRVKPLALGSTFTNFNKEIEDFANTFNKDLIDQNIIIAKEASNRDMQNFLNNVVENKYNRKNVFKNNKVKIDEVRDMVRLGQVNTKNGLRERYGHKSGKGREMLPKGISLYDAELKKYRKSTANDIGKGYEYDEILSFRSLIMNDELLTNAIIIYGDVDKAISAIMGGDYILNQQFLPKSYNGSKGQHLGSSDEAFKFLDKTKEGRREKAMLAKEHTKKEKAIRNDLRKRSLGAKLENKIQTVKNMLVNFLLGIIMDIISDSIMEIAGEIIFTESEKSVKNILLIVIKKDRIKRMVSRIFNIIKEIVNSVVKSIRDFINSMSNVVEFLKRLVTALIKMVGSFVADTLLSGVKRIFNIIVKGIKLLWSVATIVKEYYKILKDTGLSIGEKFNLVKQLPIKMIRILFDGIDILIDVIFLVLLDVIISPDKWIIPIINTLIELLTSVFGFIATTIIDMQDELGVNKVRRELFIDDCIY